MTSRASFRISLVVLFLALQASPARPQRLDSIPIELASALLSHRIPGYGGPVEFLVGEAPADLDIAWPAGSRIVGAAMWGEKRWVTVATVEGPAADAIAALRASLVAGGWKEPEEPPVIGGFRQAGRGRDTEVLCGDDRRLRGVAAEPRPGGGSLLLLTEYAPPGEDVRTPCDPPRPPPPFHGPPDVLPPVEAPEGARVREVRGGGSGSSSSSRAVVETDLGAEALLEHFARQLEDAGWRRGLSSIAGSTPPTEEDVGFVLWRIEEEGESYRAALLVAGIPGEEDYEARLEAWKPGGRD